MTAVVSSRDTTATHIRNLLDRLGTTSTDVAQALLAAGCNGARNECGTCPIAVYLLRSDLGALEVEVSESQIRVTSHDGTVVETDTPEPVGRFITGFDFGHFPLLVKAVTR